MIEGTVPGSAGFARSVSVCPPWWSGISLGPSIATIAAPHPGTLRCNTVGALAGDESAGRILSADSGASGALGVIASAHNIVLA
jgi:hypothetical protein